MKVHPNLVSDAVRELIAEGWVIEGQAKAGGAGRAPVLLYINPQSRLAMSVSYDRREIRCALVNAAGDVIQKTEINHAPNDPEDLVEVIVRNLERFEANNSSQIIGLGIADPGMVDNADGQIVRSSQFPGWHNVPLAALLAEKIDIPVLVENSTRVRAIGEYMGMPELRQTGASMLYLEYGEGIGFSFITADGIWRGEAFAGELGHVVIERGGNLCGCGARGCLESLANSPALEAKAKDLLGRDINSVLQGQDNPKAEAIFAAAIDGDRMARGLVEEITSSLGLATAFVSAALHPKYIVVGAESAPAIRCLTRAISSAIHDRTLPEIASSIEVIEGREYEPLALTGAALMVFRKAIMRYGQTAAHTST